jgi:hypothetical protein
MNYILTPNQIDRVMKPYWDEHFDNSRLSEINFDGEKWFGLTKNDSDGVLIMLVGHPLKRENEMWYCDGPSFRGGESLFGIDRYDFNQSMKRYLNKKFDVQISDVM